MIIPAKDESRRIAATVRSARAIPHVDLVLVVDDGSEDDTQHVAREAGAVVVRHSHNRGKAAAMETGAAVVAMRDAPDRQPRILLFIDGDLGETAVNTAPLVPPVFEGHADLSIALLPPQPGAGGRGIVVGAARRAIASMTGWTPTQPLSGMRCLTREAFEAATPLARGWGVETGMTIDLLRRGFRVVEVPCDLRHRPSGHRPAGPAAPRRAVPRRAAGGQRPPRAPRRRGREAHRRPPRRSRRRRTASRRARVPSPAPRRASSPSGAPSRHCAAAATRHGTATAIPVAGTTMPESFMRNPTVSAAAIAANAGPEQGDRAGQPGQGAAGAHQLAAPRPAADDDEPRERDAADGGHQVAPGRQHAQVHGDLAADDVPQPAVEHGGEEPAEVGAVGGRAHPVEHREPADHHDADQRDQPDPPPADLAAAHDDGQHREREDQRGRAAEVAAQARGAVDDHEQQAEPGDRRRSRARAGRAAGAGRRSRRRAAGRPP